MQVKSLEALGRALYLEVLELRKERDRALESRTLLGHAKNLMGYLLSAYCLYKCAAQFDATSTATADTAISALHLASSQPLTLALVTTCMQWRPDTTNHVCARQ